MFVKAINWVFRKRKNEEQKVAKSQDYECLDGVIMHWDSEAEMFRYIHSDEPGTHDTNMAEQSTFD